MPSSTDLELTRIEANATHVLAVAASRGLPVPPAYVIARQIADEASKQARQLPPAPQPTPTKTKDVGAWVDAVAQQRAAFEGRRVVAQELHDRARLEALRVAIAAASEYLAPTIEAFTTALADFRRLVQVAPPAVAARMSTEQLEAHAELLGAVEELSTTAADRVRLALVTGELEGLNSIDALWAVLDPGPDSTVFGVRALIDAHSNGFPASIEGWAGMSRTGLSMAGHGEISARAERWALQQHLAGNTPDGGLADKRLVDLDGRSRTQRPDGLVDSDWSQGGAVQVGAL